MKDVTKASLLAELEVLKSALSEAEERAEKAEKAWAETFDALPLMVTVHDSDFNIVKANKAAEKILDLPQLNVKRAKCFAYYHGEENSPEGCPSCDCLNTGKPASFEKWESHLGRHLEIKATPTFDEKGVLSGLIHVVRDITGRKEADERISNLLGELKTIFDTLPIGIAYLDAELRFLRANKALCDFSGFREEDLMGKPCYETIGEYADDPVRKGLEKVCSFCKKEECAMVKGPTVIERPMGDSVLRVTTVPEMDGDGNITHFLEIFEDITERKRAKEELGKREKFLNDILDSIQDGISILDKDLNIIRVNQTMEKWYAHKMPLVDKKCHEAYHGRNEQCDVCPSLQTIKSGKPTMEVVPLTGPEGVEGWLELYTFPHLDSKSGQLIGVIEYVRDITERRRAEEALRLTQFSVDNAGDAAYWMGPDAKFFYVNDAACRALGYSRDELLTMTLRDIDPNFPEEVWSDHWRNVEKRRSFTIESRHRTKDGRFFPVEIMVNHLKFDSKEYHCAFARDISERKQAEAKLKMLTDELKRSNQELSQFAAVAAHDLQSPLVSLASSLKLLRRHCRGKLDPEGDAFITHTQKRAADMQMLIKNLLNYSNVDSRSKRFKHVDCEVILEKTMENIKVDIQDSGAEITHDPLPEIMGNSILMVQLFQNLIVNAIKFRGEEIPRVHISAERKEKEWLFSFRDNGIGIDLKYIGRIFEIFERLHEKGVYAGSGIGLATCKKIVELHGGSIWVESDPGKGSTFFFTIPTA